MGEPSRTQQLRTELAQFVQSHGRQLADMFVVVESRAWLRGTWFGFKAALYLVAIGAGLWYWWVN